MMETDAIERLVQAVDTQRLTDTAIQLIEVPSPTRSASGVADRLAEVLESDGFIVERPVADWPEAPAVVARYETGQPGSTLQFDGHLDTVHLPFVAPSVEDGILRGSGAADMKGGIAACVEALRVLRDTDALVGGGVLLTAHDHHEGPWGDRRQLYALIHEGYVGDAVILPEYLANVLPLAGRGMAIFDVRIGRAGEPVHEVLRSPDSPNVLGAGARLVTDFHLLDEELAANTDSLAGRDSIFVGRFRAGEIFNQSPTECEFSGTRRWITPGSVDRVKLDFVKRLDSIADLTGTCIECDYAVQGDAFRIDENDPIVSALQIAHTAITGAKLPIGGKPFVDDGNSFAARAGITAVTHGPAATGAHTLDERVAVAELVRLTRVYVIAALGYCPTLS